MSTGAELNIGTETSSDIGSLHEYLTFSLAEESYGIDILKVQEIRGYGAITKIANTPEFIKGVVNLRGLIVPIVDLRIKFGLGKITYDDFTVVIILNVGDRVVGIVVDGVSDAVGLKSSDIKAVPDIVASIDTKYITGLASIEEKMLILVDIEQLMTSNEMALIDSTIVH